MLRADAGKQRMCIIGDFDNFFNLFIGSISIILELYNITIIVKEIISL